MREWWDDLCQDMSVAARAMLRSPGFTAAVVLTLALGIGASSAMFTVVDAVLLRPFGSAEPERLVVLTGSRRRASWIPARRAASTDPAIVLRAE